MKGLLCLYKVIYLYVNKGTVEHRYNGPYYNEQLKNFNNLIITVISI
jgi:hypothetical protein